MGLLDAALTLGMILGTFLSSFIFEAVGYIALFAICTTCTTIALLYTYFFIPESVQVQESDVFVFKVRLYIPNLLYFLLEQIARYCFNKSHKRHNKCYFKKKGTRQKNNNVIDNCNDDTVRFCFK